MSPDMKRRWILPAMLVFGADTVLAKGSKGSNDPKRVGSKCKWQRSGAACGASVAQNGAKCGIRNGSKCGTRNGSKCG